MFVNSTLNTPGKAQEELKQASPVNYGISEYSEISGRLIAASNPNPIRMGFTKLILI